MAKFQFKSLTIETKTLVDGTFLLELDESCGGCSLVRIFTDEVDASRAFMDYIRFYLNDVEFYEALAEDDDIYPL